MDLKVDQDRCSKSLATGIYVRSRNPGLDDKWGSYDISELDRESLKTWLRSRGGENAWAENVVGMLLDHEGPLWP